MLEREKIQAEINVMMPIKRNILRINREIPPKNEGNHQCLDINGWERYKSYENKHSGKYKLSEKKTKKTC